MQKFKEWLRPVSDFFINGFADTFQLLLDNFLGDYLEDPKQLNMITLIKGVEMLKLNKAFINQLLGQSAFRLEEAYIESIKVANLKFEARGLKLVFAISQSINIEELEAYIDKTEAAKEKEKQKLAQLAQLREEVYKHTEYEQSCDQSHFNKPQTGLIQFLSLADTLLSNSSLTIKDINIVLIAEKGKEYKFHIHQTNVDFQKPDQNNLLYISLGINLIELQLAKEQIALIRNALKFEMVLETKHGRVSTKIDGKMSSLDLVVNKKQIQSLLQSAQNYLAVTDELNKCILKLKVQPIVEFDETVTDSLQKLERADYSIINSIPAQKFKPVKFSINPQYIDNLNVNLQQSLATHPIKKENEQQFIEFSQSIFNSSFDQNNSISNSLKNQTETLRFQFDGIRIAVCESSGQFPEQKGRFFQDLEDHFFIEVIKIELTYHQDKFTFKIQSIGAHKVKIDSNVMNIVLQSQNQQDLFKSCKENPRLEFRVTPVIMMGLAEVRRVEQDFAIYIFDHLQEECKHHNAIDLQISRLKGQKNQQFYMITGSISEIIASLNHELLLSLLSYLPQNEVQQLPTEELNTPCMYGFDLKIPYININYVIMNKPFELIVKELKLKQSSTRAMPGMQVTRFEGIPSGEDPLQFICVSFYTIWIAFQNQNIITIGQHVYEDKQIFPLLYISLQQRSDKQMAKKVDLKEAVQQWQQKSETLIRGSIPLFQLNITQDLLFWLIPLSFHLKENSVNPNKSKVINQKKQKSTLYFSLTVDTLMATLKDTSDKDLFVLQLQEVSLISSKEIVLLAQNILVVDCQLKHPVYNDRKPFQKFMTYPADSVMIYRTRMFVPNSQIIQGQGSKKLYSKPLEVDFEQYILKVQVNTATASATVQYICLRVPDFSFSSLKKLQPLLDYFNKQQEQYERKTLMCPQIITKSAQQLQDQMQKQDIEIRIKQNVYIDIFPVNETEELQADGFKAMQRFSTSRALIKLSEVYIKNNTVALSAVDLFVCRQNGFEFQCPIILEEYFTKLHAFQFFNAMSIKQACFKDNILKIDQIQAHFRYDIIQTLSEILEETLQFIPKSDSPDSTQEIYEINNDLSQQLIPGKEMKDNYKINVGQIELFLEEGHTFYQMPIYFQDACATFEQELYEFVGCSDNLGKRTLDTVKIVLTSPEIEIELYDQGQIGIKLRANLEILDNIASSKFACILSTDFESFPNDERYPIECGLILENSAYTGRLSIVPMRICISGSLLQFFFNFQSSQSWIQKAEYSDQITICSEIVKKSNIWLKNLQILDTNFNVTYDSEGLRMDDFFKGVLKLSSFCNLSIPISFLSASMKGTAEEVVECLIQKLNTSLGSKITIAGKALSSLEAFSIVTNLVSGMMSLILKPFQEGLVKGTKKGMSDFSNSIVRALLKTIRVPSSAIVAGGESIGLETMTLPFKYMKERSQIMLDKLGTSGIPKRFLKKY